MAVKHYRTTDLAAHVLGKLEHSKHPFTIPPLQVLEDLFECLFYASMRTEESDLTRVALTLLDPNNPDPQPPNRISPERWSCVNFLEPIPLEIKSLVKLSKAADPSATSLAVYYDKEGKLFIWGMIDQAMHYQSFLNYETDSDSEQPGIFQVFINDIGTLKVLFDYELLATLKQNILVPRYLDVFTIGPISKMLRRNATPIKSQLKAYMETDHPQENYGEWDGFIDSVWTQTLSRMLLKIQDYHHGGAFLITDDLGDLDIKYQIHYDRLTRAMCNYARESVNSYVLENAIQQRIDEGKATITKKQYVKETISIQSRIEMGNELKGAVSFIASQSCVDGVVVFGQDMVVKGFGAVIKTKRMPRRIYVSATATATPKLLKEVSPDHFGTRHRSMISFCWRHPGSLGLVVSQDGDIRAFSKIEDKLIMWENIKTQQYLKSKKLKRS